MEALGLDKHLLRSNDTLASALCFSASLLFRQVDLLAFWWLICIQLPIYCSIACGQTALVF